MPDPVCNSDEYHAEAACAALEAGKPVLLEKPAALTLTEIERMIELQGKSGCAVLIGYMRSFADAVHDLLDGFPQLGQIRLVLCRDIIGSNEYFLRQVPDIIPTSGLNEVAQSETRTRIAKALGEYGIDGANKALVRRWQNLCAVGVHDLSTLRYLFGSGAYILADAPGGNPEVILIASGSEVSLAVQAHGKLLAEGVRARLVSMPSWDIFEHQTQTVSGQRPPTIRQGPRRDRASLHHRVGAVCRRGWPRYRHAHLRRLSTANSDQSRSSRKNSSRDFPTPLLAATHRQTRFEEIATRFPDTHKS
jgi:hypothetical protein